MREGCNGGGWDARYSEGEERVPRHAPLLLRCEFCKLNSTATIVVHAGRSISFEETIPFPMQCRIQESMAEVGMAKEGSEERVHLLR